VRCLYRIFIQPLDEGEESYIQPPPGVKLPPGYGYRLRRAIYGHKNEGYHWDKLLRRKPIEFGYTASTADPCLFIKRNKNGDIIALVGVYVDDLNLTYVRGALDDVKKPPPSAAATRHHQPSAIHHASTSHSRREWRLSSMIKSESGGSLHLSKVRVEALFNYQR
jgi:hypothetical protein